VGSDDRSFIVTMMPRADLRYFCATVQEQAPAVQHRTINNVPSSMFIARQRST